MGRCHYSSGQRLRDTYGWGVGGSGGVAGGSADLGMLIVRYQYNIHMATDGQRQM